MQKKSKQITNIVKELSLLLRMIKSKRVEK